MPGFLLVKAFLLARIAGAAEKKPNILFIYSDNHKAGGKKLCLGPDPGVSWWVDLRDGDLKYIRTLIEGEVEELNNLKEDLDELIKLARNPAYRRKVLKLREKKIAELKRSDAGMVDDLPKSATLP